MLIFEENQGLMKQHDWIAILDFGSQYTQLIARRVREQHVYSGIVRHDTPAAKLKQRSPAGIILSGGPKSVGVMGDGRTYENTAVLRVVTSQDGMTADWARLPHDLLARLSNRGHRAGQRPARWEGGRRLESARHQAGGGRGNVSHPRQEILSPMQASTAHDAFNR